jgi:MFS family permease
LLLRSRLEILSTAQGVLTLSAASQEKQAPIPRTVWILSWISFFADVSSEIIYPILPFLAVGAIGMSRFQVGLVEGAAVLLVAIMSAVAGFHSDRSPSTARLMWIRIGYGLPMIARVVIALATNGWVLAGGRLMDRFGKGLRGAPRDSLLADCVESSQLGRAFGLHRALDTAGALSGVLLAAVLMMYFDLSKSTETSGARTEWELRSIIWLGALLGGIAFAITWRIPGSTTKGKDSVVPPQESDAASPLSRSYWRVMVVLMLFSLANSSDAFLLLRAADLGFSASGAVLLYAVYNAVYAAASYPLGRLSDRINRRYLIGIGWSLYAVVYLLMGALSEQTRGWVWLTLALYGLSMACTEGIGKAMVADLVPKGSRGKALGIFYALTGLAQLIASAMMGLIWDWIDPAASFYLAASLAFLATLALPIARASR